MPLNTYASEATLLSAVAADGRLTWHEQWAEGSSGARLIHGLTGAPDNQLGKRCRPCEEGVWGRRWNLGTAVLPPGRTFGVLGGNGAFSRFWER